jgi:integrase
VDAAELRTFLESVSDDRLVAAWRTLASTAARRGELLALRWRDLDLDAKRLRIERSLVSVRNELAFSEPKTKRGRRSIALDSGTAAELRAHRARQSKERLALGLGRQSLDGLVFTDPLGQPVKPDSFSQFFKRRAERLKLPTVRLHDLRHLHATMLLGAGANVKAVSERLGHASTSFTMDVYASSMPALDARAAEQVAALIRDA